jgi:hypothetical protein
MECLTAALSHPGTCAICGVQKQQEETWFLITENGWEDRLSVWKWDPQMAVEARAHSLCSPRHVRELVVHWMTTGCLHYPFASTPDRVSETKLTFSPLPKIAGAWEPIKANLGEISVDREGILRVLQENPLSLNTILDELMIVLDNEQREEELDSNEEPHFVLPSI